MMVSPPEHNLALQLRSTRRVAWIAMFWERIWPLALPLVCIFAIFVAVSWMGLWPAIPNILRIGLLVVFGLAGCAALYPFKYLRIPSDAEVNLRIENRSGLEHRPVSAQDDVRADIAGSDDPFARALWQEHQKRMGDGLANLKVGTPVPKVAKRDPFALRAVVGLFLFIGVAAGWGNWSTGLSDAFRSHDTGGAVDAGRIDAWVTPPAYTNRPPIFLDRKSASITVPEGSELVVRVLNMDEPSVHAVVGDQETSIETDAAKAKASDSKSADDQTAVKKPSSQSFKYALQQTGIIKLRSGADSVQDWAFVVLPDNDPSISFEEEPSASNRGALEFSYSVEDDYGVAKASAEIVSTTLVKDKTDPLVEPPELALSLPRRRAREGTSKTSQDLTAHPWAGAEVKMTLIAEDEAGQTGKSDPVTFVLPERIFTKPLAKAIVEERRNLALDANAAPSVAEMLDIITDTHPDEFIKDVAHFTALRVAYRMVKRSENKEALREAIDLLWETALSIEDGDLSLAERRLRDAQERLAKALENGASDAEIDELMKELRAAMENFMRELAEQTRRNQQNQQAMPLDPNTQVLRQQDLERMMKQIEDLAKSGSKDAARQLLEELQRMMNNLQTARPNQQQQQQTDEFSKQMNKLGDMMRQQQQLMDETFNMQRRQQQQGQNGPQDQQGQQRQNQQGQGQQQPGEQGQQKPMTPEEFAEAMKQLQKQQGELQRQMEELQKGLSDLGMDPGKKLGEAGQAMGEAEQQLGQGETGPATGQQGRALQAMREGAQQMMQNMQNQAGEQGRRGERGQHGEQSRGDRDPLGRQRRSEGPQLGNDTKVPGEFDAQRARRILDAIRKKLGETGRPKLELDYLDRLLPTR